MTPEAKNTTELITVAARTLVQTANRLGLTWLLRLAVVTEVSNANSVKVRLDGDSESISAASMIGTVIDGSRVYVISLPPAGNFVVGAVSRLYPGQRIATTTVTTDSAGFTTTETQLASVVASVVEGYTYKVVFNVGLELTVDGVIRGTLRENTVGGTIVQLRDVWVDNVGTATGLWVEGQYTATATEDKTFVATGDVLSGGGTANLNASASFPSYLYVDFIQ
jgi:hypothetical protein